MVSNVIGQGVSTKGITQDNFQYVFNGATGLTQADIGKAVTLDTSGASKVKLAGNGEFILGRIFQVEDRVAEGIIVVTVETEGGVEFVVNPDATASSPDETPAVGDYIAGAADDDSNKGYVQKKTSGTRADKWLVTETRSSGGVDYVTAISV